MAISIKQKFIPKKLLKELYVDEINHFKQGVYAKGNQRRVWLSDDKTFHLPLWYARNVWGIEKDPKKKVKVKPWNLNLELREYQKDIIKECMDNYNTSRCNILQVFCGFGKTPTSLFLAYRLAKNTRTRTLILLPPNRMIRTGWTTCIQKFTDADVFVYGVHDKKTDPEMKRCKKYHPDDCECQIERRYNAQIIVATKDGAQDIPDDLMESVGHLILDEAHLLCTQQSIDQILRCTPFYVTVLTATFEKKNGLHRVMELIAGETKITRVDTKPFYIVKVPTKFQPIGYKENAQGHKDWHSVQSKFEENEERNEMLVNIVEVNKHKKTLILCYHVQHVELLAEK